MRNHSTTTVFVWVFAAILLLCGSSVQAQKTLSGTISVDTTLDLVGGAVYDVLGNVTVNAGVTLTIDPGVTLKFRPSTQMTVNGTLFAEGVDNAAGTIVFTSIKDDDAPLGAGEDTNGDGAATTPASGDWYYLTFSGTASNASSMRHCLIRYGGQGSNPMVRCVTAAEPTIRDCDLSTAHQGLYIYTGAAPTIRDTAINMMTDVPVIMSMDSAPVYDNIILDAPSGNGFDAIRIAAGAVVGSATITRPSATIGGVATNSLAYYVTQNIVVGVGESLVIEPGVVLKFPANISLQNSGLLTAIGGATDETRIVFTSINDDNAPDPLGQDTNTNGNATVPDKTDWAGIRFFDDADDLSVMEYCLVRFAGYNTSSYGSIFCNDASPSLIDCEISLAHYGVHCRGSASPLLRRIDINGMNDVPIAIEIGCNPEFDQLVFDNNEYAALGLLGGTLYGSNTLRVRGAEISSVVYDNLVYIQIADITVADTGDLTVDPGIVLKPRANVDIWIDGAFNAIGKADPDSQIVFTSYKDDNYGTPNDTNNDGSSTAPDKADWGHIRYREDATGEISHATLRFGAVSNFGLVSCESASPTLNDLTISDTYYGIRQGGQAASEINTVDISNTTYTPVLMSISADPVYSGINFTNVGLRAIGIIPEVIGVDSVLRVRSMSGYDDITYYMNGDLTISVGAHFRIEPGIVWKIASTYQDIIIHGSLEADGTADSNIVFTGIQDDSYGNPLDTADDGANSPAASQWGQLRFTPDADDLSCLVDHCVLAYGGSGYYDPDTAIWCNSSSPTITNNQFITNYIGVWTEGTSTAVIADNHFFNQTLVPLATSVLSAPAYSGNTFDQNGIHAVGLINETLAADGLIEKISMAGFPSYPYYNLGTTTVGVGTTLTIEAGALIKARANSDIINVQGALQANGTAGDRIVMTSITDDSIGGDSNVDGSATSPVAGYWSGINFTDTTDDATTVIEHCNFRFGGYNYILDIDSAGPTIRDNEIELCTYGIRMLNNSDPVVQDNLFRVLTWYPIEKSILANPTFGGNTLDNVTYPCLAIRGESIGQDMTLRKYDFAGYTNITQALVSNTLTVQLGATLTIEPGVVLKMIYVYTHPFSRQINVYGSLIADGTPTEPIHFTSVRDDSVGNPADTNSDGGATTPAKNNWNYIYFDEVSNDATTILDNCFLRYGYGSTSGYGMIYCLSASPTISNCEIAQAGHGIATLGASAPVISDCVFADLSSTPVRMSLISDPQFSGNQFLASNGYNALGIHGETLAQDVTIRSLDVAQTARIPYVLLGDVIAGYSSILSIEPGVIIKGYSTNNDIRIRRGFMAEGGASQDSLIVFTSVHDDFYGGDTNNNGSDTAPDHQRWGRIFIDNEAIDDSTRVANTVFRYGYSSSTLGTIEINSANPKFDNCTFAYNGTAIAYNGTAGDPAKGWIHDSDFIGNVYNAVINTGTSFTVDAENNWWGHATGPLDDSDDTGSGGLYNPGGLGDPVSDRVDYDPWGIDGIGNLLLGDVSRNGDVRAYDASLILQELVAPGLLGPLQLVLGDVNCSGSATALDAALILRYVTGIDTYFPCSLDSVATKSEFLAYAGSEELSFIAGLPEVSLSPGESRWVTIEIDGSGDLYGQEYHIGFDPTQISVTGVRLLPVAEGSAVAWNVLGDNELRIAMASIQPIDVVNSVEFQIIGGEDIAEGETISLLLDYVRLNETEQSASSGVEDTPAMAFSLSQNHPNPFNPSTTITFALPTSLGEEAPVKLVVYDLQGRVVKVLVDGFRATGRSHNVIWDSRDEHDRRVGSGVYLYSLDAGQERRIRKMLLLK